MQALPSTLCSFITVVQIDGFRMDSAAEMVLLGAFYISVFLVHFPFLTPSF